MNRTSIQEWLALPEETRKNIFAQTAFQKKIPEQAFCRKLNIVNRNKE